MMLGMNKYLKRIEQFNDSEQLVLTQLMDADAKTSLSLPLLAEKLATLNQRVAKDKSLLGEGKRVGFLRYIVRYLAKRAGFKTFMGGAKFLAKVLPPQYAYKGISVGMTVISAALSTPVLVISLGYSAYLTYKSLHPDVRTLLKAEALILFHRLAAPKAKAIPRV